MRRLILLAAMSVFVIAKPKPETYRETEDFKYSRSSTDEGHKAGYYGAQRGNMGGNYERAHNMDMLAQHQMSGVVKQVDGELGEGVKTRTGSVYTAANSRGIYGSGNYDLSNLKGRNFAEGESIGSSHDSQAYSSLHSSHNLGYKGHSYSGMNSAGYSSSSQAQDSGYSGYQSLGHADQRHIDNLQTADMSQGLNKYENSNQAAYDTTYNSQYGSHAQSEYDQSSSTNHHRSTGFGANTQNRYITTPVRVVLRPGGRVAIPIAAQTYDMSQNALSEDKNAINSDAEIFNQQTNFRPTNKVKHYEASYSYKKQWEKHHTLPGEVSIIVPTEYPFSKTNDLNEDVQLLQSAKDQFQDASLQTTQSSNINSEHRAHTQSAASTRSMSQSAVNSQQTHSGFNAQRQSTASADTYGNAYGHQSGASSDIYNNAYGNNARKAGMSADLTNAIESADLKPKSYHSSYSYHKSWERQGDPYVIKPVGGYDGQASQRLTAASAHNAAYSSQYGSHSRQAQQSYLADCDCDDEGHIRVARSYNTEQELEEKLKNQWEDLSQKTQSGLERLEDLGQQTQLNWENYEDLGQQQQHKWDNLQDLGQQSQNQWDNTQQLTQETQNQWDNLQQLGQESQKQWDDLQQLGQQTQDKSDNLEDFGQHTQRDLEKSQNGNSEDYNQHSQKEDVLTNFEHQANKDDADIKKNETQNESQLHYNNWNQIKDFKPQSNTQNAYDLDQHITSGNEHADVWNMHKLDASDKIQSNILYQSHIINTDQKQQHPVSDANMTPNLFTPLSNTQYKSPWDQNNQQDNIWDSHHYQNAWETNEFNNLNHKFEHNFQSNTHSKSNIESDLQGIQGLWNKIDNIAGGIIATEDQSDGQNFFSRDYSNFHSLDQKFNTQNSYGWSDIYPKPHSPQQNSNEMVEQNLHHHNLFDEETQSTSTTVKSDISLLSHSSPKPTENSDTSVITLGTHTLHRDQKYPSPDIGRGDIEPKEPFEIVSKPYKTEEEIESLSLTKETPDNIIVKPSVIKNKEENTDSTLTVMNMNAYKNPSPNHLNNKPPLRVLNTTPTTQFVTAAKNKSNNEKPISDVRESHHSLTDEQNNKEKKYEDIPEYMPQENLEQSEDFSQQLQGPWFSSDLFQQGFDQQNTDQQFEILHQSEGSPKTTEQIETFSLTREIPKVDITVQQKIINSIENTNTAYSGNAKPNKIVPLTDVNNHKLHKPEILEDVQQQNSGHIEDFGQQLQSSWDPIQQGYDQQNMEQQFEVFNQHESLQHPSDLQHFKLNQTPLQTFDNLQESQQHQERLVNNLEAQPTLNSKETTAVNNQQPQQRVDPVPPAVESQTQNPGFWKSVGSKFSSAKEKVFSWFKKS